MQEDGGLAGSYILRTGEYGLFPDTHLQEAFQETRRRPSRDLIHTGDKDTNNEKDRKSCHMHDDQKTVCGALTTHFLHFIEII